MFTITNDFVATSDSFETYVNTELEILALDLLANDANTNAGTLSLIGSPNTDGTYSTAEGGTLTPNTGSNGWVYLPATDYLGEDSFQYTSCSSRDVNVCETVLVTIDVVEAPGVDASTTWVVVGTPNVEFDLNSSYTGQYPLDFASIVQRSAVAAVSSAIVNSVITVTPDDIDAPAVYEIEFDYCDTNSPAGCQSVILTTVYNDHPTVSDITYNLKPSSTHSVSIAALLSDRSQGEIEGGWDQTSIAVSSLEGGPFGTTATTLNGATCTINGTTFVVTSSTQESAANCFIRFCEANPGPLGIDSTDRACVVQKVTIVVDPNTEDPGPEPPEPGNPWEGATLSGGRVFGACNQGGSYSTFAFALLALGALAYRSRRRAA